MFPGRAKTFANIEQDRDTLPKLICERASTYTAILPG